MTDWNPSDPDEVRVVYDLSAWTIDQQAELASELAEAEIPHHWDGTDLMVPEDQEDPTDLVIAAVEARLGIEDADADALEGGEEGDEAEDELELPDPIELARDAPTTEYDLAEWPPTDRMALTHALTRSGVAFRWEGQHVLLVDTAAEEGVDALLDQIERGEYADADGNEAAEADRLPFETLTTFFLAGERLRRDPLDADGLEQLVAATDLADPATPPYGVQPRLWQRTCALAEQLADALVGPSDDGTDAGADGDDDPTAALDYDRAVAIAEQLHDLLRPYV
jgi:hypothetical protein